MFCSKCGKQLPDNAAFCDECGTALKSVTAPSEEITETKTTVTAEATAEVTANTTAEVTANTTAEATPANNPVYGAFTPEQNVQTEFVQQKKSKAPLFICLGIGALVLIIVGIILAIVLLAGDDDEKETHVSERTTGFYTEKETDFIVRETEEIEIETEVIEEYDLDESVVIAEDILEAMERQNYKIATKYILPSVLETYELVGYKMEDTLKDIAVDFTDEEGNMCDYAVYDVYTDDGDYFYDVFGDVVSECESYIEPDAFAIVEVDFYYDYDVCQAYIYTAYCDDEVYVYEIDTNSLYFEFGETESVINEDVSGDTPYVDTYVSSFPEGDISDILYGNDRVIMSDGGTVVASFDGFSMMLEDGWVQTGDNLCMSSDGTASISVQKENISFITDMAQYLTLSKESLEMVGYSVSQMGRISINNYSGYYLEFQAEESGMVIQGRCFVFEKNQNAYIISIAGVDIESVAFEEAEYIMSTLYIE